MKLLSESVNLIPVIGKADTLTKAELDHYRRKVREAVVDNGINVFQKTRFADAASKLPFAVAASYKIGSFKRSYAWGEVDGKHFPPLSRRKQAGADVFGLLKIF